MKSDVVICGWCENLQNLCVSWCIVTHFWTLGTIIDQTQHCKCFLLVLHFFLYDQSSNLPSIWFVIFSFQVERAGQ